jgi:hypothetical protein
VDGALLEGRAEGSGDGRDVGCVLGSALGQLDGQLLGYVVSSENVMVARPIDAANASGI